jgi:peptidoglycan lytic transglycosylase
LLALTALIAGCGTTRPGGYYKDDGPGERPLASLDRIADAKPRVEPLHRGANSPYFAFGRKYVPYRALKPYRERGVASWYGRKFHGQPTSSGERYDMYAMSAAHPILPIPSYARVTNLANGRSVVVRINDRGPFHSGRIIDLSYAAAYRLGYANSGSAKVEVEAIIPGTTSARSASRHAGAFAAGAKPAVAAAPVAAAAGVEAGAAPALDAPRTRHIDADIPMAIDRRGVYLQLGAFSTRENAEDMRARIYRQLDWLTDAIEIRPKGNLYRLHLGPYRDRAEALHMAERIQASLELTPIVVVR